jgi:hypothetical protein
MDPLVNFVFEPTDPALWACVGVRQDTLREISFLFLAPNLAVGISGEVPHLLAPDNPSSL